MNVGLILTPVSIYQMSRGALVLWVGILSVMFLRRHLWLYQWTALVIVTTGVCLVGLSGSLMKKVDNEGPLEGLMRIATSDDDPAKVALGVMLILFAQNFTACQYVSLAAKGNQLISGCGGKDHDAIQSRAFGTSTRVTHSDSRLLSRSKDSLASSPPPWPCHSSTTFSTSDRPTLTCLVAGIRSLRIRVCFGSRSPSASASAVSTTLA